MRVLTSRFTLGALVLGSLCLLAEPADAGLLRRRNRGAADCGCSGGYGYGSGYATGHQTMSYGYAAAPCGGCGSGTVYGPGGQIMPAGGYIQPGNVIPAGGFPSPMPGTGDATTTNAEKVRMTDGTFEPATLTINVGTTVRWTNAGQHPHTVTSDKNTWGSAEIPPGGEFVATFTKPGTFDYHCKLHDGMKGTIIVK